MWSLWNVQYLTRPSSQLTWLYFSCSPNLYPSGELFSSTNSTKVKHITTSVISTLTVRRVSAGVAYLQQKSKQWSYLQMQPSSSCQHAPGFYVPLQTWMVGRWYLLIIIAVILHPWKSIENIPLLPNWLRFIDKNAYYIAYLYISANMKNTEKHISILLILNWMCLVWIGCQTLSVAELWFEFTVHSLSHIRGLKFNFWYTCLCGRTQHFYPVGCLFLSVEIIGH